MLKGKDESLNTPNNSNNNSNSNSSTPNGNDQIHKIDYKNACKNGVKTQDQNQIPLDQFKNSCFGGFVKPEYGNNQAMQEKDATVKKIYTKWNKQGLFQLELKYSNGAESIVGIPDLKSNNAEITTVKFEFDVGEQIIGTISICDTSLTYPKTFQDKLHNNVGCLIFQTNKNKQFKGGNDKLNKQNIRISGNYLAGFFGSQVNNIVNIGFLLQKSFESTQITEMIFQDVNFFTGAYQQNAHRTLNACNEKIGQDHQNVSLVKPCGYYRKLEYKSLFATAMSVANNVNLPILEKTNMGFIWNTYKNNFIQQNINLQKETTQGINLILMGRTLLQISANQTESIITKLPIIVKYKVKFTDDSEYEQTFMGHLDQKMVTDIESQNIPYALLDNENCG